MGERRKLNNFFNQPGIFGFGTSDNYLSSASISAVPTGSLATYQFFLAGVLSDGAGVGNGFALQQGAGEFKQNRANFVGVYFQDNFRVTRRLTLNLGLRYEPAFPWSDLGNRWAQVNLAAMAASSAGLPTIQNQIINLFKACGALPGSIRERPSS